MVKVKRKPTEKQLAALAPYQRKPGDPGGPGRPPRNALVEAFLRDLFDDYQTGGKDAIKIFRIEQPAQYCAMLTKLVPAEFGLSDTTIETWKSWMGWLRGSGIGNMEAAQLNAPKTIDANPVAELSEEDRKKQLAEMSGATGIPSRTRR